MPEVQKIDLVPLFRRLQEQQQARKRAQQVGGRNGSSDPEGMEVDPVNSGTSPTRQGNGAEASSPGQRGMASTPDIVEKMSSSTICVVLATDGVWDNWLYEDVTRFVMDSSCLGAIAKAADGARRVTMSFMQRNAIYSKRNFGNQADNATGIVMYLSVAEEFPSL